MVTIETVITMVGLLRSQQILAGPNSGHSWCGGNGVSSVLPQCLQAGSPCGLSLMKCAPISKWRAGRPNTTVLSRWSRERHTSQWTGRDIYLAMALAVRPDCHCANHFSRIRMRQICFSYSQVIKLFEVAYGILMLKPWGWNLYWHMRFLPLLLLFVFVFMITDEHII